MEAEKSWKKILEYIKAQISPANFRAWFSNTKIKSLEEDQLTLIVPSAFIKEQLNIRYLPLIEGAAEKELGLNLKLNFEIDPAKFSKGEVSKNSEYDELFQLPQTTLTPVLNPKYTLENFVVGLSNNVAYAAAQAVTQNPGVTYNPLFIYGGTGVGKTHLMLGIGNAITNKDHSIRIIYCSSEKFMNDYVEAIQTRKMGDFRNKYRNLDLLLIDDVQFLSGREGTQEEFFHTFNELQTKNSQVVLTSDRPPAEIEKLEDRLKSRFQGGLMVDIQVPDFDTRVAILKAKCLERGEQLPEDCLTILAAHFETNARELEGKLIQVLQVIKANNLTPTPEVVQQFLGQKTQANLQSLDYKTVLNSVSNYFNIKVADLIGPKRNKELVLPRHLAMHILSEDLRLTVEKIGQILGGRDHTTVMHGRDKIKKLINSDREVQKVFIEVRQILLN